LRAALLTRARSICFFRASGGGIVEWADGAGSPPASWTDYSGSELQQSTDTACGRVTGDPRHAALSFAAVRIFQGSGFILLG